MLVVLTMGIHLILYTRLRFISVILITGAREVHPSGMQGSAAKRLTINNVQASQIQSYTGSSLR